MCCNSWTGTGDQSIYFSCVYRETTYKLRLYLSYNSSQVWPTRISRVMESVFRRSGPNSKSIVTLTRPQQRKNASPRLLPPFLGFAATGDSDIDYCETKISSRSTIIKTNAVPLNAKHTKTWNSHRLLSVRLQKILTTLSFVHKCLLQSLQNIVDCTDPISGSFI